ncbi:hypothetical protein RB195_018919 [Necator americanus]|uniref:Uncharacterized protein n=1 Tax=Necator americanus TaxID=51031 RepID=A0ABR1CEH8_NECAM
MAICTYNTRTLASEAAIEDLMMQAKKIKYDVIGPTETRPRHPLNAVYETGEELFLGTCDSRGVGGVGVPIHNFVDSCDLSFHTKRAWILKKELNELPTLIYCIIGKSRRIEESLRLKVAELAIPNFLPSVLSIYLHKTSS